MPASANRLGWVDVMKIVGMFTIYVGHTGTGSGKLFQFVYAFHVPLFFVLSGFFALRQVDQPFWRAAHRRTVTILLPFVVFAALHGVAYAFQQRNRMGPSTMWDWAWLTARAARGQVPAGGLWFFPALWLIAMACDVLIRVCRAYLNDYYWVPLLVVGLVTHIVGTYLTLSMRPHVWSWNWALLYLLWYVIGIVLFPHLLRFVEFLKSRTVPAWAVIGVVLVLGAVLARDVYFYGRRFAFARTPLADPTPSLAARGVNDFIVAAALILVVLVASVVWWGSDLLPRMGAQVLIFCGVESTAKIVMSELFYAVHEVYQVQTAAEAIAWTLTLMAFVWVAFVPWVRRLLEWAQERATPEGWRRRPA